MNEESAKIARDSVSFWFHSIELYPGVVTSGQKTMENQENLWRASRLRDLSGLSVLDIGAWDGWFSFEAERAGAKKVTAVDSFAWSVDWNRWREIESQRKALKGPIILPENSPAWDPKGLPGACGFDAAKRVFNSRVEKIVVPVEEISEKTVGIHDVCLFFGVLYHLKDPLGGLSRLRRVTSKFAIIETEAFITSDEFKSALKFYVGDGLNAEPTNWFVPTEEAATEMMLAAGFDCAEVLARGYVRDRHFRLVIKAYT